ncbi:hypothetical protein [Bacillus toyonensis]|nr:hypothetical protein [Bacillus toyonensis]
MEDFDDELRQIDMDQKEAILVVRVYKKYLAKTDEDSFDDIIDKSSRRN